MDTSSDASKLIDRLNLVLAGLVFFLATAVFAMNYYYWHYSLPLLWFSSSGELSVSRDGDFQRLAYYFFSFIWRDFFILSGAILYSIFSKGLRARITQIFIYIFLYLSIFYLSIYFVVAIQLTPFHLIDNQLLHWDEMLHYDPIWIMETLSHYPWAKIMLDNAYDFILLEMLIVPFYLIIVGKYHDVKQLFYLFLSTVLLGGAIYFFWPTLGPACFLSSPYFTESQRNIGLNFYNLHHSLPPALHAGGPIGMPSFHVIWALLSQYSIRHVRWMWFTLLPINCLIILSTLFLGWHYFVDILGGFFVVFFALGIAWYYKHGLLSSMSKTAWFRKNKECE
jgi:hypothetical protein